MRYKEIIRILAPNRCVRIIRIAVNPEHVHNFYVYPPKLSSSIIAKKFKNYTSLHLRREFPELKKKVKNHLWAPSNYYGSVGQGFEGVENYIRGQEGFE